MQSSACSSGHKPASRGHEQHARYRRRPSSRSRTTEPSYYGRKVSGIHRHFARGILTDFLTQCVSQHEAASASVKLQRHSLETSYALERSQALEKENARLVEEISVLRAHPNTSPDPSALQNPQLNNALRELSDKLCQTEELLLKRTNESLYAARELARVKYERDVAHGIAANAKAREEDCKVRERTLLLQARNAKEESNMADLVVQVSSAVTLRNPTMCSLSERRNTPIWYGI